MVVSSLSLFGTAMQILSAPILLPSKKAEAGIGNKGLDEDPARAFISISITFKPVDFMHVAARSLHLLQETAHFPQKKYDNFHSTFQ